MTCIRLPAALALIFFLTSCWVEDTRVEVVTPVEARELSSGTPPVTVIDLRTPEEFADGHIAGATNIDFKGEGFRENLSKLDPSQPYLIHCRSGSRSTASLPVWRDLGFETIYHLDGGFASWETAGLPVDLPLEQ